MTRRNVPSTFLFRAALATALLGHWLANALFDRDQYTGAGSQFLNRLDDPLLIQGLFGLVAIGALTIFDRRRKASRWSWRARHPSVLVLLVVVQLALFLAMEASERLAIAALLEQEADVSIFGTGFIAELLVAVGSAVLLAVAGEATRRVLHGLRREPERAAPRSTTSLVVGRTPSTSLLVGGGGVRAPPAAITLG